MRWMRRASDSWLGAPRWQASWAVTGLGWFVPTLVGLPAPP